jgi:nucleotide-binding universal stress UspA family protein
MKIVVGVDDSHTSELALERALHLAERLDPTWT